MDADGAPPRADLKHYARILWRRKWVIAAVVVLAVGASLAYSATTKKVYQATAQLLLTPQLSTAIQQANNISANSAGVVVDVPTDSAILKSTSIRAAVAKVVHNPPSVIVSQLGITNVVDVSAQSRSPARAARAANAYAAAYIRVEQAQSVTTLTNAQQIVQAHIASLQVTIDDLNTQIAKAPTGTDTTGLGAQLTSFETQQATFRNELATYQFTASLNNGGGQVVSLASVPTKPVKPKALEYGVLAGLVGLIVGIGLALMLNLLDESIRTKEDLEEVVGDLPVLGLIPAVGDWRDQKSAFLISRTSPKSPPAESYRSLRTSIQFLGLERSVRLLEFTSPNAADGKTTTLANVAWSMAEAGRNVAVVCCDLRRPRVHEFFGLGNEVGLTNVLLGDVSLEDALQRVPEQPRIRLLASGPMPPNPSELLSGQRVAQTLAELASRADIVLIDSPPILPVTDAAVLGGKVDGVVVVTAVKASNRKDVKRSLEVLGRVRTPVLGVVLNRATEADSYAYYRYSYSAAPAPAAGRNGSRSAGSRNGRGTTQRGTPRGTPRATGVMVADVDAAPVEGAAPD